MGLALLVISCTNHSHQTGQAAPDTPAPDMHYLNTLSKETEKMGELTERLKSLQPLDVAKLKSLFPKSLNGYERTAFEGDAKAGYASVSAVYQKAPGVEMRLSVQDCAGEGSEAYTLNYWNALHVTDESESGYTRTVQLNGGKAVEEYRKNGEETSLTWFAAGRLLVVLQASGLNAAVLHQAASLLDFKL